MLTQSQITEIEDVIIEARLVLNLAIRTKARIQINKLLQVEKSMLIIDETVLNSIDLLVQSDDPLRYGYYERLSSVSMRMAALTERMDAFIISLDGPVSREYEEYFWGG